MNLGDIIDRLKKEDPNRVLPIGWGAPACYRGDYWQLAFSPEINVTIGSMLEHAESAMGETFEGWKGGEYTMGRFTECWICCEGTTEDAQHIGKLLMDFLLAQR